MAIRCCPAGGHHKGVPNMSPMCLLSPERASGQATSCCLTQGWGRLPGVSLVPRMSRGGVTHLLLGLGMGLPMVSPMVSPHGVPNVSLVPRMSQQLWPPSCYLIWGQGCVPGVPNMSLVPRMSHLPAATCLQPCLGTRTCPHQVPGVSPTCPPAPGQAIGCSHLPPAWLRDEEVSSPHCPQCVLP